MFLNMGNLRDTLLAVLPLGACMLQLFGIMGLLNIPFNPANMISLPLMLGMGMDNGINIVYDFRRQLGRYRMSPSTAVAVVLNTLTTMVGFAVLMIADHRGLQSLGRVLTIGMSCSLVSSLIILPAFLAWITRNRQEETGALPEPESIEQIAPVQSDAIPNKHDYYHDYPHTIVRGDESRPLSEIWQRSNSNAHEGSEEVKKEEILHFPPASPHESEQSWPRKRSA
jgi:multidrug efflux pump subunit AcrB